MAMDVGKIAQLANLPLTDEELKKYSTQLDKILDYVDQLQKTDTSGISDSSRPTDLKNVSRADEIITHPPLANGHFKVKAIFDNE